MSNTSFLEAKWPIFPFLEYIILVENQVTFDKEWKSYLSHVDFFLWIFQRVNEWWDMCASKCIKKYNPSREIHRKAWEILLFQVIEMQQLLHAGHLWRFLEPVEDLSKYNIFWNHLYSWRLTPSNGILSWRHDQFGIQMGNIFNHFLFGKEEFEKYSLLQKM